LRVEGSLRQPSDKGVGRERTRGSRAKWGGGKKGFTIESTEVRCERERKKNLKKGGDSQGETARREKGVLSGAKYV